MYCKSCGKQISNDSRFCKFCGAHQDEPQVAPATSSSPPTSPPIKLIVPTEVSAPRRAKPSVPVSTTTPVAAAPAVQARPSAPASTIATVAPAVQAGPATPIRNVTTSGEWDFTDFVHSFAGRKLPALKVSGSSGISMVEARKLFWQSFQNEISNELQRWAARGWQPTSIIGPEALELRKFNGYRDKGVLFWIIVIVAAIPSVGMSLIWGLIPAAFVEPTRFIAKMRAPHGTPLP